MRARGLTVVFVWLGALIVGLSLWSAPALAAAPEAPYLELQSRKATPGEEASLRGVLYPNITGEPGSYEFLYRQSASECTGGSKTASGIATGNQFEEKYETLTGLTPGKQYTVCLSVTSPGGTTLSPLVTFTAPIAAEAPNGLKAESVAAMTAALSGVLNPLAERKAEPGTYEFLYKRSASECEGESATPAATAAGGQAETVSASLGGLLPRTQYTFCLRAANEAGESATSAFGIFTTLMAPPAIEEESASRVASSSATLNATINPENTPTSWYFQYGTSAAYEVDVPMAPGNALGSGLGGLAVNVHLQGLTAGAVYHYRVVAIGDVEGRSVTVEGPDETFTTQMNATGFSLPDGRSWELVSPPNKQGSGIIAQGNEQGDDIQAAEDGGAITYGATAPITGNAAGASSPEVTQVMSTRRVPGSWETSDITPPHNKGGWSLAVGHSAEYKLFSSDLSLGAVEPADVTPLPPLPADAEKTDYLRHNFECAPSLTEPVPSTCYQALASAANLPPGTKINAYGSEGDGDIGFVNATPDFSHLVIQSNYGVPLTSAPGDNGSSYVWSAGKITSVGGYVPGNTPHVISNDGSRVTGTGFAGYAGLDLHDMATGETIQMDVGTPGYEQTPGYGTYWTANGELSRVFFKSAGDLYVFELTSGAPLAGNAIDLTVDKNPGEGADVAGVPGASEDGSTVYFVATGVLSSAANGEGEKATSGAPNLYMAQYDEGRKAWNAPVFIARLSGEDYPSWGSGGHTHSTSRVSSNGRYFAFMSDKSLTGYENRDANSGAPDEEVFLYEANTGRLVCASCNPTGARPVGLLEGNAYEEKIVDYAQIWSGRWFAANVPGWTSTDLSSALLQSRYLSDNGRLFFNSNDALVPADVNGKEDVYEYEPEGVGSCRPPSYGQSASEVFVPGIGGCVALISAGTSAEESAFMEATEGGGDVFFLTLSQLSSQDTDTSVDLYDAHECSGDAPCAPTPTAAPPPCTTGDSCKAAPSLQPAIFGNPPSATFSGAGNVIPVTSTRAVTPRSLTRAEKLRRALKACRKKRKRSRAACERRARKAYRARAARIGKSMAVGRGR